MGQVEASVQTDDGAVQVFIGSDATHQISEIRDLPELPGGGLGFHGCEEFLIHGGEHRSFKHAWSDGDHSDFKAAEVSRHGERHAADASLASGVGNLSSLAFSGGHRGHVDDYPALSAAGKQWQIFEMIGRIFGAEEGAEEVDVNDGEERLRRMHAFGTHQHLGQPDARAVHKYARWSLVHCNCALEC